MVLNIGGLHCAAFSHYTALFYDLHEERWQHSFLRARIKLVSRKSRWAKAGI